MLLHAQSRNCKGVMKNIRSRPFWLSIGLIITDGLFFGLTNPVKVASIVVIVGFALLTLSVYWLSYNLQKILSLYAPWLSRQRNLSLTLTGGLASLLALQSIGQLTMRDSLLIPVAALAVYAYLGYGKRSTGDS